MKDFYEFYKQMSFKFTNDSQKLAAASSKAGVDLTNRDIGAAYSVAMYLLQEYHKWVNEKEG